MLSRAVLQLAFIAAAAVAVSALPPPAVLFNVIIDDLGWANVGWHTSNPPENLTPRLHALASSGIILEREYHHFTCTPSRSSWITGRLPVHVQTTLDNPDVINSGVPREMTALPLKLAALGYQPVFAGKWDMGWASKAFHSPEARGYNRSLAYAEHMNNYWTQAIEPTGTSCANGSLYDLWEDGHPATELAGRNVYIDDIFSTRALEYVADFVAARASNPAARLFLDVRPHSMHWPLMVSEAAYNNHSWVGNDEPHCSFRFYGDTVWPGAPATFSCRRQYQAMLSLLDARIGSIVDALTDAGLWEDTFMTFSSDNGEAEKCGERARTAPLPSPSRPMRDPPHPLDLILNTTRDRPSPPPLPPQVAAYLLKRTRRTIGL